MGWGGGRNEGKEDDRDCGEGRGAGEKFKHGCESESCCEGKTKTTMGNKK